MKLRPAILLGGIAILAGLLALVLWSSKRADSTAAGPSETAETVEDTPNRPVEPDAALVQPPQSRSVEKEGPIVFYGKLEDQAAEPVAEAEIIGTMVFDNGAAKATARFLARSDAEGFFKLEAGVGESLELMPRKEGYALASTNNLEFYTHLKTERPDPNRPVILKMWKRQGAEPLATFNGRYKFGANDTPACFDFVTQTFVPTNGDIKITIHRPAGVISPAERPDWSVELEGVDGGLMKISAAEWGTTYWAPADGYRPKQVLLMSTNAPNQWSQSAEGSFFVQTRDGGVYTKLSLKVGINLNPNDPLDLALWGVANTNGSCNWEGDPSTLK